MNPLVRGDNEYRFGSGGEHVRLRFIVSVGGLVRLRLAAHYHGDEEEVRLGNYQVRELRDVLTAALEVVSDGGYITHPLFVTEKEGKP